MELEAGARLRCARAAIAGVAMAALPFCGWAGSASARFGVTVKVAPAIALGGGSAPAAPVQSHVLPAFSKGGPGAQRTLSYVVTYVEGAEPAAHGIPMQVTVQP